MVKRVVVVAGLCCAIFAPAALAAPCAGFTDVDDSNPFCANVVWIKNRNITLGCAPNLYCPNDNVSRLTMAAFLNRLGDAVLPPKVLWVANVGGTFDSIQAAIDFAVAQGAHEFNPYLVKVAPGTYLEQVTLKNGVDVEGAGQAMTLITSNALLGTVTTGAKAELRNLKVQNTGNNPYPNVLTAALWQTGGSSRIRKVEIGALSVYGVGVYLGAGEMLLESSRLHIVGGSNADTVVQAHGQLTLRDVDITSGALSSSHGVVQDGGELRVERSHIAVMTLSNSATAIRASGGLTIQDSTVLANGSGSTTSGIGLLNAGTALVRGSSITASGATARAIQNSGSASVHASILSAASTTSSISFLHSGTVGRIANSQLIGGTTGAPTCFGAYDAAFIAVGCP